MYVSMLFSCLCHPLLPPRCLSLFSMSAISVAVLQIDSSVPFFLIPCICVAAAAAAKLRQSCLTLCTPKPTRLPSPWDSPGKNTGVGCHFLLQCMKVKRESEVAQSCLTLRDPMDCSPPGSSVHGIFQARVPEWGYICVNIQ